MTCAAQVISSGVFSGGNAPSAAGMSAFPAARAVCPGLKKMNGASLPETARGCPKDNLAVRLMLR